MDSQIERLLCEHCRPIVAAALDVERSQLALRLARDKLRALGLDRAADAEPDDPAPDMGAAVTAAKKRMGIQPVVTKGAPAGQGDLFKGRRTSKWRDVAVEHVLRNIRGEISPGDLCDELEIAGSVLSRRVRDIIGNADAGKRWLQGVGYIVKGKPAWDHERGVLRVDKTKGAAMAAMAAVRSSKASVNAPDKNARKANAPTRMGRKPNPGPTDDELRALMNKAITGAKLGRKYKCGKSKIYRDLARFKERFGADAPHGTPKGGTSNGAMAAPSNGASGPVVDMARVLAE